MSNFFEMPNNFFKEAIDKASNERKEMWKGVSSESESEIPRNNQEYIDPRFIILEGLIKEGPDDPELQEVKLDKYVGNNRIIPFNYDPISGEINK